MDSADEAQMLIDSRIEDAIRSRKTLSLPFSGFCLSCQEPIGARRFCDADCRSDYEAGLRRRAISPT